MDDYIVFDDNLIDKLMSIDHLKRKFKFLNKKTGIKRSCCQKESMDQLDYFLIKQDLINLSKEDLKKLKEELKTEKIIVFLSKKKIEL